MGEGYLPEWATTDEACEWLVRAVGGTWTLPRLLEHGAHPSAWLDWSPHLPGELFGDRHEGFMAPFIFAGDLQRLSFDRTALLTVTVHPSGGEVVRFKPGIDVPIDALRFAREAVHRAALRAQEARAAQEPAGLPESVLESELWSLREAAYLLSGQAPRDERAFRTQDRDAVGPVGRAYSAMKNATIAGTLAFLDADGTFDRRRVKPADAVAWAMQRGAEVPEPLRRLGGEPPSAAPEPEAAPVGGTVQPPDRPQTWQEVAVQMAKEVRDRDLANDRYPSIRDLAAIVAERMRAAKIFGPQGKPLSAETIARHALQGAFTSAEPPTGRRGNGGKRGKT